MRQQLSPQHRALVLPQGQRVAQLPGIGFDALEARAPVLHDGEFVQHPDNDRVAGAAHAVAKIFLAQAQGPAARVFYFDAVAEHRHLNRHAVAAVVGVGQGVDEYLAQGDGSPARARPLDEQRLLRGRRRQFLFITASDGVFRLPVRVRGAR